MSWRAFIHATVITVSHCYGHCHFQQAAAEAYARGLGSGTADFCSSMIFVIVTVSVGNSTSSVVTWHVVACGGHCLLLLPSLS